MTEFTLTKHDDGVAIITWDLPGKSMNVLTEQGIEDLKAAVDAANADDEIKGVVLTSAKPGSFAAGADLNMLAGVAERWAGKPDEMLENTMKAHHIMRAMERNNMDPKTNKGGKPYATALPGTALGAGYEVALATHRIFCAPNPKAKIGLPEILVGVFPGGGGTTRLIRKFGLMAAAPYLLQGKTLSPDAAKKAGLIDEIADDPVAAAREWVLNATDADILKPWDVKGYKMPGGAPYHPQGFMTFAGSVVMARGQTQGAFPAVDALLNAAYNGALVPFDTALKVEARWFNNLLMNPSSAAMIRTLFLNKGALEKGANRPDVPDQTVKKVGILGAGMMGAGIANVSAKAGIEVVLIDQTQEAADKGKAYTTNLMDKAISRGKSTEEKKEALLSKITASTDLELLKDVDLIVEAVFEDPGVKAEMTKKVEAIIPEDAIFASNTSTLPITGLAKASVRPEQFIGIHFFSPVDKMLLVEIIKGKETGDRAVAKALDFVRQIRKTPIVVNDARYFYANRCIVPSGYEAYRMAGEGIALPLINNAGRLLGFPVGSLQLMDETSVDLLGKIARATMQQEGEDSVDPLSYKVISFLEGQGRLGRKANAGFYEYDEKGKRLDLWTGFNDEFPLAENQPSVEDVQNRLMLVQVLEAVRALEENVLLDIREGDVGAVLGWGFAPWSGGPFGWLDIVGASKAVEMCEQLEAQHGERFKAPALLREMADKGETFYGRFAA
ncbi:Fatty acid oxidation complex subunit alpha [Ruegeria sp. THAF57]|uniref:3-hydroxyacyl-CoA dehydrogenase NAD-binding domain-containing protein n=1 Tax=Ruegeria sp. THAF57 TaxID=2744555 RepID=UPI0015DE18A2|nr:3-hydroxyacyl-CoA dehydrogenase NAD-binding domain-containing protein [Ruegeria sp. THAF57]CAD0187236.1 Fatty acid oxidation complex subunit alpha [Ruegeria sp. THAF57]